MSSSNNTNGDSNVNNHIMSIEEFTEEVLKYFKNGLKDSFHCEETDQSDLVRRSWKHFDPLLKDGRFKEVYMEVLFSVFEIFPFTSPKWIGDILYNYLSHMMDEYCYVRKVLVQDLPLDESPLNFIDYYLDTFDDYKVVNVEYFCSPWMILDFDVMKRWLRYGGRFLIYPLETEFYLTNILSCLTVKLLPLVYEDVLWNASRIMLTYKTYREQRRLYLVLLFVYVILQSNEPEFFPKWRSCMSSLKLVFKASPEPFISAQEIDRFLRVAVVGELDQRVSEDLRKKFKEEFPNFKEHSAPRSLKQLSRCAVRDVLIRSETLPHGVWYLDVPMPLKHYLLLQEKSDEFYPAYVDALRRRKMSSSHENSAKRSRTNV